MKLGIIGGSGLYNIESLQLIDHLNIDTPFGQPSDTILYGKIYNTEIYFLPRHGSKHTIAPHELNHKANIYALKKLGITHILSISAVGSLKECLRPKDIVLIDQFYDRTKQGANHTFFGNGIVAHIPFSEPICKEFHTIIYSLANKIMNQTYPDNSHKAVESGTYVNMEGPAFSTKAESNTYRQFGFDVIGMTCLAEAKLAREAEICYCNVSMVTDYDCWHPDHDNVTVDMVINTMKSNTSIAKKIIIELSESFPTLKRECKCSTALNYAIMTDPLSIKQKLKRDLKPIIGKYINCNQ